jgi:hypothetical protein
MTAAAKHWLLDNITHVKSEFADAANIWWEVEVYNYEQKSRVARNSLGVTSLKDTRAVIDRSLLIGTIHCYSGTKGSVLCVIDTYTPHAVVVFPL